MEDIINIIMRRDGMSYNEARELVENCKEEIIECAACGDYDLAESIMTDDLMLEIDYIPMLLLS